MRDDALRTAHTSLLALMATIALWLFTFPAVQKDLYLRSIAEDLVAWLVLKNTFTIPINAPEGADGPFEQPAVTNGEALITDYVYETEVSPGEAVRRRDQPIRLFSPWPRPAIIAAELVKADDGLYDIRTGATPLPFRRYKVLFTPRDNEEHGRWLAYAIVIQGAADVSAEEARYRLRSQNWHQHPNKPHYWQEIMASVIPLSGPTASLQDIHLLTFNTPAVKELLRDSSPTERIVLGIPLDPGLFFSAIGIAVGVVSFVLLGPVCALRSSRDKPISTHWTMVTRMTGFLRVPWEILLTVLSTCGALMPLSVVALQLMGARSLHLRPLEMVLIVVGVLAAIVSSTILALLFWEFGIMRRNSV